MQLEPYGTNYFGKLQRKLFEVDILWAALALRLPQDIELSWRTPNGHSVFHISRFDLLYLIHGEHKPVFTSIREGLITTDEERRYADFFNKGYKAALDVESLSLPKLQDWIRELEDTVSNARATLHGADLAFRERSAKLDQDERDKLRGSVDSRTFNVADSVATVKKRQERMTKMDKLEIHLREKLGLSDDEVKSILSNTKIKEDIPTVTATKSGNGKVDQKLSMAEQLAQSMLDAERKRNEPKVPSLADNDEFFT